MFQMLRAILCNVVDFSGKNLLRQRKILTLPPFKFQNIVKCYIPYLLKNSIKPGEAYVPLTQ